MRPLFSDGFNSLAHFGLGVGVGWLWCSYPLASAAVSAGFVAYQFKEKDADTKTDLTEFALGLFVGLVV